jgi:hypothetical protein
VGGLRFDEAMGLSGGEDTDFFMRAKLNGARIFYSAKPAISEEVPRERMGFWRQMKLAFRNGANDVYLKRKQYGGSRIFIRRLPQILLRLPRGLAEVTVSPVFAPFGLPRFKMMALEGGRKIFKSLGVLASLGGWRPRPYERIDGY